METNHTPGPWGVVDGKQSTHPHYVVNDDFDVARCVNESDARLIAAAPELLAALNGILDVFGFRNDDRWEDTPAIRAALDAIAKATGDN